MTSPHNITIRHARSSDAAAMHEIWSQPKAQANTMQLPWPAEQTWENRLNNIPEGVTILVAEARQHTEEAMVIGNLGLRQESNPRRRHVAHIGMAVHDDWHGYGTGSALMSAAIELCDNWLNISRIELDVYTDNDAALALYQKFGFEIEGTFRNHSFRHGKLCDTYAMARLRQ